jgi:methylmalonyl-CoA mutase
MDIEKLVGASDFPQGDRDTWLKLVDKALKGADYDMAMVSHTDDGIAIDPLAARVRDPHPLPRRRNGGWTIVQRCDDTDLDRARAQAIEDVEGGATGLSLVFEGAPNAFGYGLPEGPETLSAVLDDIPLDRVHLRADAHPSSRAMADHLVAYLGKRRVDPARLSVCFGIDSAATFAGTGRLRMSIEALQASMPQSLAHFFTLGVPGVLLEADGRVYHNAGATEAQELGAALAGAVAHLKLFEEARQALVYAAPFIGFAVSVNEDQFISIAKIRALRLLWQRAQEACSIRPAHAAIHAETSWRMMTARDAETNILRSTLAAFAAAAGGADSISVLPHTAPHGLPAPFARRVARNLQVVLARESHVGFVADPAAGSGAVEALTEALCEAAWAEFQRIQGEGGLLRSLAAGALQARVIEARDRRVAGYRTGERVLVGTTLFSVASGSAVETLPAERRPLPSDGTVFCQRLDAARLDTLIGSA